MSLTLAQIFALNPTTVVADTDLYYLVQSPYTPGTDAAITGASLKAAFGTGGTVNAGLINQVAFYPANGNAISGLPTAANGALITSAGGVPSISSTLPNAVQDNITRLGTITSITTPLGPAFGGTGINNGTSTITVGGNFTMVGAFTFTGTLTGNTAVTFPITGTLATTSQIPTGAPLTKVDDTNVTLTLGGTPALALVNAASLTLGWTGLLGLARGGTNANLSATGGASQVLQQSSAGAAITVGQLAASNLSNGTTGSGAVVLATSPTLVTPILGVATATTLGFSPTTGGIIGTNTNNNTTAGNVGEYVESIILVGSAVALTSLVAANITSISLTAGDWSVWAEIWFNSAGTTVASSFAGAINTVSATFPTVPAAATAVVSHYFSSIAQSTAGVQGTIAIAPTRVSLSGTTNYFLNTRVGFATSTMAAYGKICARRIR